MLFRMMALSALVALVAFTGCSSDDDPAAPPGPGGGGGFTLPAGVYTTSMLIETCVGVPIVNDGSTEVWCTGEIVDELPGGLYCTPVQVGDDSVTVDCSGTEDLGGGCSIAWTAVGGGKRMGDTWSLSVHIEIVDTPDGCYRDPTCLDVTMSAMRIGDPPSACTYAEANTFNSTITGGPMAGRVPFSMGGGASSGPGGISWGFGGQYPEQDFPVPASSGLRDGYSIGFSLDSIDPKSLPRTLNVSAGGNLVNSAGQTEGFVNYSEYDSENNHEAFSSGGGGTVTVQEVSDLHIAGTISLNIDVMSYSGPQNAGAQETSPRTITGGFYIQNDVSERASVPGVIAHRLLQSLRGYVE
jgi:hypothetical protein